MTIIWTVGGLAVGLAIGYFIGVKRGYSNGFGKGSFAGRDKQLMKWKAG